MTTLRARAYAKINLGLRILGRRADGFHELRTIFQTISLADTVTLRLEPGRGVRLEAVHTAAAVDWPAMSDEKNLACRAAQLAQEEFGPRARIGIGLVKRIPVGAGLGGGSADAAAVLRLLAGRARQRPPAQVLLQLAATLGSDVPALLLGGTVLGLGRGEECYRLPSLPSWHVLVAMPPGPVATAAAYQRWDQLHPAATGLTGPEISANMMTLLASLWRVQDKTGDSAGRAAPASRLERDRSFAAAELKVRAGIENDFEEVVFPLSPDFSALHRALKRSGAVCVGLSGSGAAQFALFSCRQAALAAQARLGPRARSWTARFVAPPAGAPMGGPAAGGFWGVVQR